MTSQMTIEERQENIDRLEEIRMEMIELLGEADRILIETDREAHSSAHRAWIAGIECELSNDTQWIGGGSAVTFEDTLNTLNGIEDEDGYEQDDCDFRNHYDD